jgi:hypothetical protein
LLQGQHVSPQVIYDCNQLNHYVYAFLWQAIQPLQTVVQDKGYEGQSVSEDVECHFDIIFIIITLKRIVGIVYI